MGLPLRCQNKTEMALGGLSSGSNNPVFFMPLSGNSRLSSLVMKITGKVKRIGATLKRELKNEGVCKTACWLYGCVSWELCKLDPLFRRRVLEHRNFDREFGCDTDGVIKLEDLALPVEQRTLGYHYEPCFPWLVREFLSCVPGNISDYTYIDLGSGKGRALLIAAQYPFKKIVGVEYAAELSNVAADNIGKAKIPDQRCFSLEALCLDAAQFEFPPGPLLLSLFNPFGEVVLRKVLENLAHSLAVAPRPVVLAYINPKHQELVVKSGLFTLLKGKRKYNLYRHWA